MAGRRQEAFVVRLVCIMTRGPQCFNWGKGVGKLRKEQVDTVASDSRRRRVGEAMGGRVRQLSGAGWGGGGPSQAI